MPAETSCQIMFAVLLMGYLYLAKGESFYFLSYYFHSDLVIYLPEFFLNKLYPNPDITSFNLSLVGWIMACAVMIYHTPFYLLFQYKRLGESSNNGDNKWNLDKFKEIYKEEFETSDNLLFGFDRKSLFVYVYLSVCIFVAYVGF